MTVAQAAAKAMPSKVHRVKKQSVAVHAVRGAAPIAGVGAPAAEHHHCDSR